MRTSLTVFALIIALLVGMLLGLAGGLWTAGFIEGRSLAIPYMAETSERGLIE